MAPFRLPPFVAWMEPGLPLRSRGLLRRRALGALGRPPPPSCRPREAVAACNRRAQSRHCRHSTRASPSHASKRAPQALLQGQQGLERSPFVKWQWLQGLEVSPFVAFALPFVAAPGATIFRPLWHEMMLLPRQKLIQFATHGIAAASGPSSPSACSRSSWLFYVDGTERFVSFLEGCLRQAPPRRWTPLDNFLAAGHAEEQEPRM